ncbi:hypothetical protein PC117_g21355 [Phytophthora cactorum]|uniref:Uncharacterized protein n=1 Tax=Phytophthora cactorum TaxID=29920 RepID=A0A8T1BHQ0_9STRA|nr:hypothetical protein PC117_g21355 [Phytophthora cactorum]
MAAPCSKTDLRKMMLYLLKNTSTSSDYEDAALLCNLTIDATDILFVRFICLKTSEEQELPLFPDLDFVTCPVYAIALALITQTAP